MRVFRKLAGNYIEVLNTLPFPEAMRVSMLQPQTEVQYLEAIDRDENRSMYFADRYSIYEMKQRLRQTHHLTKQDGQLHDPQKPLIFNQGDFSGASIGKNYIHNSLNHMQTCLTADELGKSPTDYSDSICLHYVDDDNANCGITISFLKQPSLVPERHPDQRPFVITIIRHSNLAPVDRDVTCYIHPELVDETPALADDPQTTLTENLDPVTKIKPDVLRAEYLSSQLEKAIGSQKLSLMLKDLFRGDTLSHKQFKQLKKKIKDNNVSPEFRDALLDNITAFVCQETSSIISNDDNILHLLGLIRELALNYQFSEHLTQQKITMLPALLVDPSFTQRFSAIVPQNNATLFRDMLKAHKKKLSTLNQHFDEQQINLHDPILDELLLEPFHKRHRACLLILGTSILTAIGLGLLIAGALAPLGLILVCNISFAVATLSALLALVLAAIQTVEITLAESHLKNYQARLEGEQVSVEQEREHQIYVLNTQFTQSINAFCHDLPILLSPPRSTGTSPEETKRWSDSSAGDLLFFQTSEKAPSPEDDDSGLELCANAC